jgi:GNAT superfamily N-acetyltransferase
VAESARRAGVASALMAAAEESALGLGMELVELETGPLQPEAVGLYQATGWHLVEQLPVPISDWPNAIRFYKRYRPSSS